MIDDQEPERFGVIDTSTDPFEYFLLLTVISIYSPVMVTLSMTLKTYLHINLLCHNILSFFISSLSHLVQNPLLIAMEHL